MTRSIDFAVIDTLRDSASRGQHAHVIQETFVIDIELQNLQLHLLDLRARSYVACAKFNTALETATKMQQINPATALGYLSQGYIHMEQGRYIAATHVYDTALERVDKHDPLYDTIHTAKAKAMQQGEKRTDFICDLPMDISDRIIKEVLQHGVYDQQREYVMVSWAWWHRIMATNHLKFSFESAMALEETSNMVIQSFNHVRSLVYYYGDATISQLLEKYPFRNLTILHVKGATPDETMAALRSIGTQLTRFTYQKPPLVRNNDYTVQLQDILETCPNLVSFDCQSTVDISSLQQTYPKLQMLAMYTVVGTVDDQTMLTLQQHLPGLKILDMAIVGSSRPLTLDDPWLPAIRHLGYGDRPGVYHQKLTFEDHEQQGLVTLSITPTSQIFALDDIAPLIIHHHATLQLLALHYHWNTTHTGKMTDAMHNYRHVEFTRLKKLVVFTPYEDSNIQSFSNFIAWVIQHAPYLQEITLKGHTMNKHTLKAMVKCIDLRTVLFDIDTTQRPEDYDTLMAEFLRDHANYLADKGGSRLESIKLRLDNAEPMLIDAIKGLKSLKTLQLSTNDLAPEPFARFFDALRQGCHSLKGLHIENAGVMPNRVLYQVSGLTNLEHLTISGNMDQAQAGVLSLQRCQHLRHLESNYPIDEDIEPMIREKLPGCYIMAPGIAH